MELFNENLIRGKGLLARAIMKAQTASPLFTPVYAALLAAVNTKLPENVQLVIHRIIIQFQKAFRRNKKNQVKSSLKFIAHLVNQQVIHELLALQILALFLESPTEDSIELAAEFFIDCGQVLSETTPAGVNAIFERFRTILHDGKIERRVQYTIEKLFQVRKQNFKNNPGVVPELDLIEEPDKITHNVSLDDEFVEEANLNVFKFDPSFREKEA
jgi:pre-mRNA-splicing factor CWC22